MDSKAKIGAALAGGYLLGRTKKGKLALSLALWLGGSQLGLDPKKLVREGIMGLARSPELRQVAEQIRGPVSEAGRNAVASTVESRLNRLSDNLQQRTAAYQAESGQAEGAVPHQQEPSDQPSAKAQG